MSSVLVIDGDEVLCRLISSYLKNFGVETVETHTEGGRALERAQEQAFDLIVLDWKHKRPTGREIFDGLREAYGPALPIILVSGFVTQDDVVLARSDRNTNFLVKPFTEEILVDVVVRAFEKATQQVDPPKAKPPRTHFRTKWESWTRTLLRLTKTARERNLVRPST